MLVVVAVVAVALAVAGGFAALAGIHLNTVAGTPKDSPAGLLIPLPAPGKSVAVTGDGRERLPAAEKGEYVDYLHEGAIIGWRLDSFDDSDDLGRTLARLGDEGRDGYHWALVRYTERLPAGGDETPDLGAEVFLVDDRGLMLSSANSLLSPVNSDLVHLPPDCPQAGVAPAPAGTEFATCAVFVVPDDVPVIEVAVSDRANARPLPTIDPGVLKNGARIAVTGRAPRGAAPTFQTHRPGAAVAMHGADLAGDVAVIGLVTAPSAYLNRLTTPILTGTSAMILRIAVRPTTPVAMRDLAVLGAALLDERGTPIDPATPVNTKECADVQANTKIDGTAARCLLFAVPNGARPAVAVARLGSGDPQMWALATR